MTDGHLALDLALAWGAAGIGGLIAQRLRQPPILGYLLAGVVIGPFTPGPVVSSGDISVLAEIGVAFLMFALGVEFSLAGVRDLGRVVVLGGPLQVVGTMALGLILAYPLGLSFRQGLFLGGILALSSTIVALKILMGRDELQQRHGRISVGLLIAQDLAVVPLVIFLPVLTHGEGLNIVGVFLTAIKAAAVVAGVYVVGVRLAPWVLKHAALGQSRELFLLGIVGMALGTAVLTQAIGLSLAFGAFLAGLTIAESTYRTQVLAEILPFRDLFTALFFVSIGLLINPGTLLSQVAMVGLVSAVVIIGKTSIVTAVVAALGVPFRVALLTGAGIAQTGEFSFVLAMLGVRTGVLSASLFNLVLATAVVTIVLSSPLLSLAHTVAGAIGRAHGARRRLLEPAGMDDEVALTDHTVICGYGRVGREVAAALQEHDLPYIVIDLNPEIVEDLQSQGVPVLLGDATSPVVLEHAHLERARLLAVLLPAPAACEVVTIRARELFPGLDILARASSAENAERLRQAGATNMVQPEFEAGVTVVGYALRSYGLSGPELARTILARRASYYHITNRTW